MKNNKTSNFIALFLILISFETATSCHYSELRIRERKVPCDYVNPIIGTDGHGHTFPGATLPFGMVQLSPDTYTKGWDWCSGYHYSDSSIMGFSHTHLSGTGRGDLLDILLMPTTGKLQLTPGSRENPDGGYRSGFSHSDELASPGYYMVMLKDYQVKAELTSTIHSGFHRYTFPKSEEAHIILDLFHGYATDTVTESSLTIVNDSLITGYRKSRGWGEGEEKDFTDQQIFFAAVFSKSFASKGIVKENSLLREDRFATGNNLKAYVNYSTYEGEQIMVKVGISGVDLEGAMKNLSEEIPHWDFDKTLSEAKKTWRTELEKIFIEEAPESVKTIFYTAIYHSMIAPYTFSDVDGRYRGFDGKIHSADGHTQYTVFSLWDTFRAENPLYTILHPERVPDMVQSMLNQYIETGLLPVWPLWGSETNCMIGYHAIPVITDAYLKGFPGINMEQLYPAMKKSAMQDESGIRYLKEYNYIPFDKENKSVSKTLEYAFDDWCIAQVANELGKEEDYLYFMKRSQSYKNLFDPQYNLMNGISSEGNPRRPFDPAFSSYGPSDFIEGNSWQYSFFVPHDIPGLIALYGGKENFSKKLDELFMQKTSTGDPKPLDVTGLIGEYAHGNEPSHQVAYLYNYADQPWKSQYWLHKIMTTLYKDTPDGLCGNEDCGQMSAWYIFSSLGLYPVNPASGNYDLGTPVIGKAILQVGKNPLVITAIHLTNENLYVQKIELNGRVLNKAIITHNEILEGGTLKFYMGKEPPKQ
jgi:predicted alpha-1,2-mannosidase